MLVLARKRGEQIIIADNIILTVVDIDGGKIRLGIDAPPEISVHRKEIWEQLHSKGDENNGK